MAYLGSISKCGKTFLLLLGFPAPTATACF
jgi:hypothetical protein